MEIIKPRDRQDFVDQSKTKEIYDQFENLLKELENRDLPDHIIAFINSESDKVNAIENAAMELLKTVKKSQRRIIRLLDKELKLVPRNYYRSQWIILGMVVFGLPFGVAFGMISGNMALIGVGVPLGMSIGIGVGAGLDKKASKEGRQLDVEIKF